MDDTDKQALGKQFARGSTMGSIALATGYLAQYLFQVSVSRVLGAEAAGTLFIAFAFVLLVSIVARLGMDKTGLKVVSAWFSSGRLSNIREVTLLLSLLAGLASVPVMAIVFFSRAGLAELISLPQDKLTVTIICLSIPLVAVSLIFAEVLRGMRLIGLSSIIQLVAPYGMAITFIWSAAFLDGATPHTGALAFISGFALSMLLGVYFIFKSTTTCNAPLFSHYPEVVKGAPAMLWSALILFGIAGGDVIILGYFVPSNEVAYYFAASRTAMLISVSMVGINSIVIPMIASAFKENNTAHLGHIARMGARLSLTLAAFFAGFLFIGGEWVLSLFGPGYEGSFLLLLILLAGQLANSAVGAVAFIMFMSGQERSAARILTLVISAMMVFYVLVIPEFGIKGAALITALGVAVWNLGLMRSIHRKQGVITHADNLSRCAIFLFIAALFAFVSDRTGAPALYSILLYLLLTPFVLWKYVLIKEDRDALISVAGRHHTA